jgi:hypothetical protein
VFCKKPVNQAFYSPRRKTGFLRQFPLMPALAKNDGPNKAAMNSIPFTRTLILKIL